MDEIRIFGSSKRGPGETLGAPRLSLLPLSLGRTMMKTSTEADVGEVEPLPKMRDLVNCGS